MESTQTDTKEKPAATVDEPTVSQSLSDEIDGAVETTMTEVEQEREETEKLDQGTQNLPPDEDRTGEEAGGEDPGDGKPKSEKAAKADTGGEDPGEDAVTDELLERAVKAGLSMGEARKIASASALGTVCDRLEALGKKDEGAGSGEGGDPSGEAGDGGVDPLDAIPDLDPDEYDEQVVAGFKAMKDLIRQQRDIIGGLKTAGANGEKSWFDSKVSGLGDAFGKAMEQAPEKRAALQEQFDVLSAGYKAAGKDIEQDVIFEQAVSLAMGDVAAQAAADSKAEKLGNRASKHIARPGGGKAAPTTDAYEDTAAELDRKFFNKK